jgi:hypothetical protein
LSASLSRLTALPNVDLCVGSGDKSGVVMSRENAPRLLTKDGESKGYSSRGPNEVILAVEAGESSVKTGLSAKTAPLGGRGEPSAREGTGEKRSTRSVQEGVNAMASLRVVLEVR